MTVDYECARCAHHFAIEVDARADRSQLTPHRPDACPNCEQRVGTGPAHCRSCGHELVVELPHWHLRCNLAGGDCPACGERYTSLCIC